MVMSGPPLSYKPSTWYYRQAIRGARSVEQSRAIGLHVISEYERLREWVRKQGMIPPKWEVDPREAKDKGWPG